MARKNRNLAGFDEVASTSKNINTNENKNIDTKADDGVNDNMNDIANLDVNENTDVDTDINNNDSNIINANVNVDEPKDYLDKLIEGKPKKAESEKALTGIYLEKDLSQILDRLAKRGGRGAKSRIVNEALRSVFKDKGLL